MIAGDVNGDLRVGKVISSNDQEVTVNLCRGGMNTEWTPLKDCYNNFVHIIIDNIHMDGIFTLTNTHKLPSSVKVIVQKYIK